jgi:hypothetical protein
MAQEKPLDLSIVQAWLSAWNERDIFSDAAVRHLQSLIADPLCLVVVTMGVVSGCLDRRLDGGRLMVETTEAVGGLRFFCGIFFLKLRSPDRLALFLSN